MQKNILILILLFSSIISANENISVTKEIQLTLNSSLQKQVKSLTLSMKEKLQAKSVTVAVMDSRTGNILSLADSNTNTTKDYPKNAIANFTYEPGFIMAPFIFSLAIENKLITPYTLISGHQGHYQLRGKIINDHHPFDYMSAENILVYSSNIGMAQIAQKIPAIDYYDGLIKFGFTQSVIGKFSNEKNGFIPDTKCLEYEIYKAPASYGYGVTVNLLQLLQAYNVFNNNGMLIKPRIVTNSTVQEPQTVIDSTTAYTIKKILIKSVEKGTGKNAKTPSLEIGGKTGTAYVVQNGKYLKKYNCSFAGFVNGTEKSYTIAVLVQEPQTSPYASETAVITFKGVVDILVHDKVFNSFK